MSNCLLCREKRRNLVKLCSKKAQDMECPTIIAKHFFFKPNLTESVCSICWDIVFAFHQLYETVAAAQHSLDCAGPNLTEEPAEINFKQESHDDGELLNETEIEIKNETSNDDVGQFSLAKSDDSVSSKSPASPEHIFDEIVDIDMPNSNENDFDSASSESDPFEDNDYIPNQEIEPTEKNIRKISLTSKKKYDESIAKVFEKLECYKCKMTYQNFDDLREHAELVHKSRPIVKCCSIKYTSARTLSAHALLHLDPQHVKCQHCDQIVKSKKVLKNHIKDNHKCKICSNIFNNRKALHKHMLLAHTDAKDYKHACSACDAKLPTRDELRIHMKSVHNVALDVSVCHRCGKQLFSSKMRQNHLKDCGNSSRKRQPVQCDICGKWLSFRDCLRQHKIHLHSERQEVECPLCKNKYCNKVKLQAHIKRMHENDQKQLFSCAICGKSVKTMLALKEHENIHTKAIELKCEKCDMIFYHKSSLDKHVKRIHNPNFVPRRYQCEICEKLVSSATQLIIHKKAFHEKSNVKCPCPICGMQSANEFSLKKHIHRQHKLKNKEQQPFAI